MLNQNCKKKKKEADSECFPFIFFYLTVYWPWLLYNAVETRYKDIWYNKLFSPVPIKLKKIVYGLLISEQNIYQYNKQNFLVPMISLYTEFPLIFIRQDAT